MNEKVKESLAFLGLLILAFTIALGVILGFVWGSMRTRDYYLTKNFNSETQVWVNDSWVDKKSHVTVYLKDYSGSIEGRVIRAFGDDTELHYEIETSEGLTTIGLGKVNNIVVLKKE